MIGILFIFCELFRLKFGDCLLMVITFHCGSSGSYRDLRLLRKLEKKDLDVLGRESVANGFKRELKVGPLSCLKVVEHHSSIAIFLLDSLLDHLL